jgi:hypothetical protein
MALVKFAALIVALGCFARAAEVNLALNPGIEEGIDGTWGCYPGQCNAEQSTDAYAGVYSLKISGR